MNESKSPLILNLSNLPVEAAYAEALHSDANKAADQITILHSERLDDQPLTLRNKLMNKLVSNNSISRLKVPVEKADNNTSY